MSNAPSMKGCVALVVGGAGFVGSNLCHRLMDDGVSKLIVVDNFLSSDRSNLPDDERVAFVLGSITENGVLKGLPEDLEYVFHLACYHGNQSSIVSPLADHENNLVTTLNLFDRLKDFTSLKKVIYAGAGCAAADKTFDTPVATTEDAPISLYQDSPYSISKIVGEMYGNYYFAQHALPVVTARFQNVYGMGEILGAGRWRGTPHTVWRNVVPTFVWKAIRQEALPLENGGLASRDFIFVEDVVDGLILCATKGVPGQVYNLASGAETTIRELAEIINDLTSNNVAPDLTPARDWDHSGRRFGSTRKAERDLGFRAHVPLREGLRRTVDWTRANAETIERCIRQHDSVMASLKGGRRT